MNCEVGLKAQAGQRSALLYLPLLYNQARDFGSTMENLPFPAYLGNIKALEDPAPIPEPEIEMFIACFMSAKNREWK